MAWDGRHLVDLDTLDRDDILGLIQRASVFRDRDEYIDKGGPLAGQVVGNLFLENSTRTRLSFVIASRRLGGGSLNLIGAFSSTSKGETLLDTARTVAAMGVHVLVIRCGEDGGPAAAAAALDIPVVNAGDGTSGHPTAGRLDAMALTRHLGGEDLDGRRIAIVGDVAHSRVARSNIQSLVTLGASVALVGPPELAPADMAADGIDVTEDLDGTLPGVDAVMMLRVQFERDASVGDNYADRYGLTTQRASLLPAHAPVMHPGPMNRGFEIDDDVADGPRSIVVEQVACGVAMRMAVLERLLS